MLEHSIGMDQSINNPLGDPFFTRRPANSWNFNMNSQWSPSYRDPPVLTPEMVPHLPPRHYAFAEPTVPSSQDVYATNSTDRSASVNPTLVFRDLSDRKIAFSRLIHEYGYTFPAGI